MNTLSNPVNHISRGGVVGGGGKVSDSTDSGQRITHTGPYCLLVDRRIAHLIDRLIKNGSRVGGGGGVREIYSCTIPRMKRSKQGKPKKSDWR
jgi:hypothetical protein